MFYLFYYLHLIYFKKYKYIYFFLFSPWFHQLYFLLNFMIQKLDIFLKHHPIISYYLIITKLQKVIH